MRKQRLPARFLHLADTWYLPLAEKLKQQQAVAYRPLLVGITGSQGSGKSTLASLLALLLERVYGLKAASLSMDDFYLTRAARRSLADKVHPLLATRGVPGTHDLLLMQETLTRLARHSGEVAVPGFDKALDDRYPAGEWQRVTAPLDIVIVEGWCLGTPPQRDDALRKPINRLEAEEDPDGIWRRYVNQQIGTRYQSIYAKVDSWIMLQAPSFGCIYQWRLEQEKKLADRLRHTDSSPKSARHVMSAEQIEHFIQHYQRLTEHALQQLPDRVNHLFKLDADREIEEYREPQALSHQ